MWEPVDWSLFDIVATDAYRDASNAGTFRSELRKRLEHGKPLAVTEFGCCGYAGAADRGGMGWTIIDASADPPRLDGDYVRDESEQVRYLEELTAIFAEEGVDLAFWFTFAGYPLVHDSEPHRDLDMASYGVVRMLPAGPRQRLQRARLGTQARVPRASPGGHGRWSRTFFTSCEASRAMTAARVTGSRASSWS